MYEYILLSTLAWTVIVIAGLTLSKKRDRAGWIVVLAFAALSCWGIYLLLTQFWLGGAA